jgi:uncharacterized repeat protein (TIGR03803 family)
MLFSFLFLGIATDASAQLTAIHKFNGADGSGSLASLILGADGNFYGTTEDGGAFDHGTVFRMTPAGAVTVLHSFTGGVDGNAPVAALLQASDGNFYGTTSSGGPAGFGLVFKMTPAGSMTTIYSFSNSDGSTPRAAVIQTSDGNLYGTTQLGGLHNRGTLFGMTLTGTIIFHYSFTGAADGAYPYAPVIQAKNGVLYGTVYAGDFSTFGRVFKKVGDTVTVAHTFLSGADGANPLAALVEGIDGNLYGTTRFGGTFNEGTVFKMAPDETVTILKSFDFGPDGARPQAALIQPRDGNFYGTTRVAGAN